jgi:myo-inositol 2-dehydrogenase / D-chiro-inositol 1-dehydrogenase
MNENPLSELPNAISTGSANPITRRHFLAGASAAAVSFAVVNPRLVGAAEANSKVNIGLIGCGGRGSWIAGEFAKHGGYKVVAVADYFQDKADSAGQKLGVPDTKRFTGLKGYRKLLEEKLDAVMIESPPYFHPEQAAAAVEAGKHVYLAKPVAVDVPGCQTIAQSGKNATVKKLAFLVDFQTRATPSFQQVAKRILAGEIGTVKTAEAAYQCSLYFADMDAAFRKSARDASARIRAWAIDRVLSGDIITEQNIHALDVATWFLNAEPVKAVGTGGRVRDFLGDCWDHFSVIFTFPQDVIVTFCSKQYGAFYDDIMCRVYGTNGSAEAHYGGKAWVRSREDAFEGGWTDGVAANIATFHKNITEGHWENPTVAPSVRSNLTTILGRTAAYRKGEATWADMIKTNEKLEFDTRGLKA